MKRTTWMLAALSLLLSGAVEAKAGYLNFVNNPTTNSTDFQNYVASQGGTVNKDVNFNAMPTGPLQSNFYLGSDGVTLTTTGSFAGVLFGAGPGQGNIFTGPTSSGEGLHPNSNYLYDQSSIGPSTLTISFTNPVAAVGLFTIDYFGPFGPSMTITAYSGANGTGTTLATASSVQENFQENFLYFMGISSTSGNPIGSLVFSYNGSLTGDDIGLDNIEFARFGPALTTATPEPASVTLLGIGIVGMIGYTRRMRKIAAVSA